MKRISFFLVLALLLSFGLATADQSIICDPTAATTYYNDPVEGDALMLNQEAIIPIHIVNTDNPDCFYLPAIAFEISDGGGGATWTWPSTSPGDALYGYEKLADDSLFFGVWIESDAYFDQGGRPYDTLTDLIGGGKGPDGQKCFSQVFKEFQSPKGTPGTSGGPTPDYVGIAGVNTGPRGLAHGMDHDALAIKLTPTMDGSTICVDRVLDMPAYEWGWSPLAFYPPVPCTASDVVVDFNLINVATCWYVGVPPDLPPSFGDCTEPGANPTTVELNPHCSGAAELFCAVDPDPDQGVDNTITYDADYGSIDGDGNWTLATGSFACEDVGSSITMTVTAVEADQGDVVSHTVNINLVNDDPAFTSGCDATALVGIDETLVFPFTADDECNDALTFTVTDPNPGGFLGTAVIVGSALHVTPVDGDEGDYTFEVCVTDCASDPVCCNVTATVLIGDPYEIVIEKTHDTPQGQFEEVAVTWKASSGPVGGFNFLIAYDASVLTFQGADVDESSLYRDCGWEYFTYRFGPNGNCGNACPSGLLRVVGIGETNNGPAHPTCYEAAVGDTLFTMSFLVSNNRTFECSYAPIRFFWIECGDNTISSEDGMYLYINNNIWENTWDPDDSYWSAIQDFGYGFPGYLGADDDCIYNCEDLQPGTPEYEACMAKPKVLRWLGLFNGGIDIVCSKDIDDRGDINLNGLAYEIADAVMFSNYFVDGLAAFVDGAVDGSIAATDVNADGLTLSVADLVYLIRVIVGDALPYDDPFLKPSTTTYTYHNGVVSVEGEMGAGAFTFNGDVNVELLADGMELKYAFDGEVTRAVVFSLEGNTFSGDVVRGSNMITLELGSANGGVVTTELLPAEFALGQNYPNPFNPASKVPFSLPTASDVTLKVYNIAGQLVSEVSGSYDAGFHEIQVDGSYLSSGVYFYKLDAGDFTATKKMVLLK